MRKLRAALLVLLFAAPLPAQDKPTPDTPAQAANKVLAAFTAKDEKALQALAKTDEPDPWLVADELCLRGEHDAAEAFAEAAPRKDVEKLPANVASRRGKPLNTARRKALAAASQALRARNPRAALAALERVDVKAGHVDSVRLLFIRGIALRSVGRLEASAKAYLAAADLAERIGWLARAGVALHEGGVSAVYRGDWGGALAAWERRITLEESRGNRGRVASTLGNLGNLYSALGDHRKALSFQERSLRLEEDLGNRAGVAITLGNIGVIHEKLGDYAKALSFQERSLKLRQELGDRAGVAVALGNLGTVYSALGDHAKALSLQERTLKLKQELGDRAGVATALANLGVIHENLGDYP
ncbi:MAG: tetratricopeptide repeat protein, partial [Planctomycetota bacterium]